MSGDRAWVRPVIELVEIQGFDKLNHRGVLAAAALVRRRCRGTARATPRRAALTGVPGTVRAPRPSTGVRRPHGLVSAGSAGTAGTSRGHRLRTGRRRRARTRACTLACCRTGPAATLARPLLTARALLAVRTRYVVAVIGSSVAGTPGA